ncbi:MAG TPA: STAS/SEC14 domain-containing protein [Chthoniobacterales bacterium]|jgi:universal stress protein A
MHQITRNEPNLVTVRATGKLTQEDYNQLIPVWQRLIDEEGSMRLLFVMEDFHGWKPGAAWDDFRFDAGHSHEVERVAMVGEKKWQAWLAKLGAIFMPERVRYFDLAALAEAERWVRAR